MVSSRRIPALILIALITAVSFTGCKTVRVPRVWDGEKAGRACGHTVLADCGGILVTATSRSVMCGMLINLPEFCDSAPSARSKGIPRTSLLSEMDREQSQRRKAFARIGSFRRPTHTGRAELPRISMLPGRPLLLLMAPRF